MDSSELTQRIQSSPYATFDQGGEEFQWNENIDVSQKRDLRGGSFGDVVSNLQSNATGRDDDPTYDGTNTSFRIAVVPEPASLGILAQE